MAHWFSMIYGERAGIQKQCEENAFLIWEFIYGFLYEMRVFLSFFKVVIFFPLLWYFHNIHRHMFCKENCYSTFNAFTISTLVLRIHTTYDMVLVHLHALTLMQSTQLCNSHFRTGVSTAERTLGVFNTFSIFKPCLENWYDSSSRIATLMHLYTSNSFALGIVESDIIFTIAH
jgi:hypothetical protein